MPRAYPINPPIIMKKRFVIFTRNQERASPRTKPTPKTIQTAVVELFVKILKYISKLSVIQEIIPDTNTVIFINFTPRIIRKSPIVITTAPR